MNRHNLVDSLGGIDENLIQNVEALRCKKKRPVWKTLSAAAACFCLLAVTAAAFLYASSKDGRNHPSPSETIQKPTFDHTAPERPVPMDPELPQQFYDPETEQLPWVIHFNQTSSVIMANRPMIRGMFAETLSEAELASLTPTEDLPCSGYANFDERGNLLEVVLQITTSLPESPITIGLADYYFGYDCVADEEEVVSVCDEVAYSVYEYRREDEIMLSARAEIHEICFDFSMEVPQHDLEQAKGDFQTVLSAFAGYEQGKPDLSVVTPEEIPELMEQMFDTLAEAQKEPDFGRYLPTALPEGFGDAIIRRFRFQDDNYLSGMWSRELDDLTWVIRPYTEMDAHRLTRVEEKENYDLSLYPIPRADSVPDELREIVNDPIFDAEELTLEAVYCRAYKIEDAGDTNGWRMKFSVRYGDIIVSVSSKGIEPEWLYDQLAKLAEQ